ncbi:MAG: hypothetical protein VYB27_02625 [Candidatus Thermoplasmatota archaeon]|nr:hypothetical protein [Candidatus Thermoplasmatota archaeon]
MATSPSQGLFAVLLTEEGEGQWLSLIAFVIVMILGAALIQVADVIPSGTENHPTLPDESSILSMDFAEDGSSLAVIDDAGTNRLFRIQGSSVVEISLLSEPTVVSSFGSDWLVGGESGLLVRIVGEDLTSIPILQSGDKVLDLHAQDGSSGWILIEREQNVELRTFDSRIQNPLSFAADIGDTSVTLTGFDVDDSGNSAIVRGISSVFSNPASPSDIGEVLFVASASLGFAPEATLVQHSIGAAYHSVHISDDPNLMGFAVSSDQLTLIGDDLSVSSDISMGGGTASTVDSEGRLWVFGTESNVLILDSDGSVQSLSVESPEDFSPQSAVLNGDTILVAYNGDRLLVIDSTALSNPILRPSLLFDAIFLAIAAGACLVLARNFQVMGFDAW